jgi:hypothetical protein
MSRPKDGDRAHREGGFVYSNFPRGRMEPGQGMSRTAVGNSMVGSRAATRLHRAPKVPRYPHLEALLEGNPSPGSPNPPLRRPVDEGAASLVSDRMRCCHLGIALLGAASRATEGPDLELTGQYG